MYKHAHWRFILQSKLQKQQTTGNNCENSVGTEEKVADRNGIKK